jgi:hypothetical protein
MTTTKFLAHKKLYESAIYAWEQKADSWKPAHIWSDGDITSGEEFLVMDSRVTYDDWANQSEEEARMYAMFFAFYFAAEEAVIKITNSQKDKYILVE